MQYVNRKSVLLGMLVVALAVGAVWALSGGAYACATSGHAAKEAGGEAKGCNAAHGGCHAASPHKAIAEVDSHINAAHKAAVAGDAQTATTHLVKAQQAMATLKEQMKNCPMGKEVAKFANTVCPIMGSRIDPQRVKPELTRQFKGQTIAFCCAGCPEKFDKLSDHQKQAKLDQHSAPAAAPRAPAHH